MAGDWIKVDHTLPDKPEVVAMSARLGIDQDAVAGKLLRVWVWADQNSVDGNGLSVTFAFLNRITACPGFAEAMQTVGWLTGDEGSISFPNFARNNGQTAKARAVTNRRVAEHRTKGAVNVTLPPLQKALPEKRREEKETPTPLPDPAPQGDLILVPPSDPPPDRPSELQVRIGRLLHRRPNTPWSDKELKALKAIGTPDEEDLQMLEDFYAARIPEAKDYRRTALQTLLNNFNGELDKARKFRPPSCF